MLDLLNGIERRERQLDRLFSPTSPKTPSPTAPSTEPPSLTAFIQHTSPEHAAIPAHLARLIALLERAARTPTLALVSMPPRHGKSVTLCSALAWMVSTQPARLNAYITYQQGFARAQSRRVRRIALAQGTRLAADAATLNDWRTEADGGLCATGITSGLTGKGFNGLVIVDDPIAGREDAESPVQREKVWDVFNSDAFSRLNPGGSLVVVATRWHLDDVIGRLERHADPPWEVLNLPAVAGPDGLPADEGEPLWPDRFPLDALRRIRAQIGEYAWASLYQGHPVPRGGALFRVPARYETPSLAGARIVAAVDAAGSTSTRADYTAAVVLAVRGTGADATADVLEVLRLQAETSEVARQLEALQRRHGSPALVIEGSRDGKAIGAALRSINPRLTLIDVAPVGDKFTRAQPVVAAWNQGRVRLPARPAPWVEALLHEAERFTGVADRHDDQCVAAGTPIETETGPRPIEAVRAGDRVWTRRGLRRVIASALTNPAAKVFEVELANGTRLIATANHPVFVEGIGFTRVDSLEYGMKLVACGERPSSSTASGSDATQTPSTSPTSATSAPGSRMPSEASRPCTRRSGNTTTGPSLTGATFTIATATGTTTTSRTWCASPAPSTAPSTPVTTRRLSSWLTSSASGLWRRAGTLLRLARLGIESMADAAGTAGRPRLALASGAASRSGRSSSTRGSAPRIATLPIGASSDSIGCRRPVGSAASSSPPSARAPDIAPWSVSAVRELPGTSAVHNLAVEGEHEYFAAGVLVHNCDALAHAWNYAMRSAPPDPVRTIGVPRAAAWG